MKRQRNQNIQDVNDYPSPTEEELLHNILTQGQKEYCSIVPD